MNLRNHFKMFLLTFFLWLAFYAIGIPSDYFLTWSVSDQLLLTLVTCFGVVPYISIVYLALLKGDHFKNSIWLAFYASIPLLLYDLILSIFVYKKGISIIYTHWYLTAGYVYVWVIIPLVGKVIEFVIQQKNENS